MKAAVLCLLYRLGAINKYKMFQSQLKSAFYVCKFPAVTDRGYQQREGAAAAVGFGGSRQLLK